MTREQAIYYMRSSGWSDEQIETVVGAFTCKDAISRQAAIDIVQNWLDHDMGYSWEEKNIMRCAIVELESLPPVSVAEKTGRWIPVSEPPKKEGRYICDYGDCIDFGSYHDGHWYIQGAVAYMPLPQPYKAESEG